MGGHNRSSGQQSRTRRTRGFSNNATQSGHPAWFDADDIKAELGVSDQQAQDFYDAVNGGMDGGFTWGWDGQIRDYETMNREDFVKRYASKIQSMYSGDANAYVNAVAKKARDCEALIDASPKWSGSELSRGFRDLDPSTLAQLTTVGAKVDLNRGTASWTTDEGVARNFAGMSTTTSFIAHCSSPRRGTSVRNLSHYKNESEILCSSHEAFICTDVRTDSSGRIHAYYDVVSTNYDWSSVWGKKKK